LFASMLLHLLYYITMMTSVTLAIWSFPHLDKGICCWPKSPSL